MKGSNTIGAEIDRLTEMSGERPGRSATMIAMCLGAVYALHWILGGKRRPSDVIREESQKLARKRTEKS